MGVLMIRALLFGSLLGPPCFENSHIVVPHSEESYNIMYLKCEFPKIRGT